MSAISAQSVRKLRRSAFSPFSVIGRAIVAGCGGHDAQYRHSCRSRAVRTSPTCPRRRWRVPRRRRSRRASALGSASRASCPRGAPRGAVSRSPRFSAQAMRGPCRRASPAAGCRDLQCERPKFSRTAGSSIPQPSSVIVAELSATVTSTRVAPARRAFCRSSSAIVRVVESKNCAISAAGLDGVDLQGYGSCRSHDVSSFHPRRELPTFVSIRSLLWGAVPWRAAITRWRQGFGAGPSGQSRLSFTHHAAQYPNYQELVAGQRSPGLLLGDVAVPPQGLT